VVVGVDAAGGGYLTQDLNSGGRGIAKITVDRKVLFGVGALVVVMLGAVVVLLGVLVTAGPSGPSTEPCSLATRWAYFGCLDQRVTFCLLARFWHAWQAHPSSG
jgi:hypothetical protein